MYILQVPLQPQITSERPIFSTSPRLPNRTQPNPSFYSRELTKTIIYQAKLVHNAEKMITNHIKLQEIHITPITPHHVQWLGPSPAQSIRIIRMLESSSFVCRCTELSACNKIYAVLWAA